MNTVSRNKITLCRVSIKKITGFFFGGIVLSFLFQACSSEESCASLTTNRYRVGFVTFDEEAEEVVAFPRNFERVRAVGSDSIFFTRTEADVEGVILAVNPAADTTTFVFENDEESSDTLQLAYERTFRMISPDCGLEILYTDLRLTYTTFDSVRLITSELSETNQTVDVEIFN